MDVSCPIVLMVGSALGQARSSGARKRGFVAQRDERDCWRRFWRERMAKKNVKFRINRNVPKIRVGSYFQDFVKTKKKEN